MHDPSGEPGFQDPLQAVYPMKQSSCGYSSEQHLDSFRLGYQVIYKTVANRPD